MRQTLLISVAAIALAAAAPASAQTPTLGPAGPSAAPTQGVPNDAATTPANPAPPAGLKRGAEDHTIPDKTRIGEPKGTAPQSTDAQLHHQPNPQSVGNAEDNNTPGSTRGDRERPKQAERPMTSRNVSLSTEQKTTIREKAFTSSAPRVTGHVNFDIRVGGVVPRTIRVAPLPSEIVEIEPTWHGYMYFVSGDEIIVVEPGSLRIVAVLDV